MEHIARAEGLDVLTHTFVRDREFCDALTTDDLWELGRLLVLVRWAHKYAPEIQTELHGMALKRFTNEHAKESQLWTITLVGGIVRDISLVAYLAVRGLISEAGLALRRSLESAGVLAHLWNDAAKAVYLSAPESGAFKNAFTREPDRAKSAHLKANSTLKRFEVCYLGEAISRLYQLLSKYTVHGGSPDHLVGAEIIPTRFSCMFMNRPDPLQKALSSELRLLRNGCEMLCSEIAFVHGTWSKKYGIQPSKGSEGGFFLSRLLDPDNETAMDGLIQTTLKDLNWR